MFIIIISIIYVLLKMIQQFRCFACFGTLISVRSLLNDLRFATQQPRFNKSPNPQIHYFGTLRLFRYAALLNNQLSNHRYSATQFSHRVFHHSTKNLIPLPFEIRNKYENAHFIDHFAFTSTS